MPSFQRLLLFGRLALASTASITRGWAARVLLPIGFGCLKGGTNCGDAITLSLFFFYFSCFREASHCNRHFLYSSLPDAPDTFAMKRRRRRPATIPTIRGSMLLTKCCSNCYSHITNETIGGLGDVVAIGTLLSSARQVRTTVLTSAAAAKCYDLHHYYHDHH